MSCNLKKNKKILAPRPNSSFLLLLFVSALVSFNTRVCLASHLCCEVSVFSSQQRDVTKGAVTKSPAGRWIQQYPDSQLSPRGCGASVLLCSRDTRVCRSVWEESLGGEAEKKTKKKQGASERDTSLSEKASLQQQQHAHDTHTQWEKSRQCLWWVEEASSLPVRVKLILPSEVKHVKNVPCAAGTGLRVTFRVRLGFQSIDWRSATVVLNRAPLFTLTSTIRLHNDLSHSAEFTL